MVRECERLLSKKVTVADAGASSSQLIGGGTAFLKQFRVSLAQTLDGYYKKL